MHKDLDPSMFGSFYFANCCGTPYERADRWLDYFGLVADRIITDINPKSVMDAGCAYGFLVEKLRQRDVEAWGTDISEYAIQHVHPSIKPYCWVASISGPFPQKYDLIVSIEVIEHTSMNTSEQAISNFCQHSDDIIFSSTPLDYQEPTHINVHPPEYWAGQFARQGFFRDLDFDLSFIAPWTVRFQRRQEPFHRIIYDYERKFWSLWKENFDLRQFNLSALAAQKGEEK